MPYVINWPPAKRVARLATLAFAALVVAGATGASPALADTSSCTTPTLTQPFLSSNDSNWYALAPGESADSFDGTGWKLYNGASIVGTKLADGTTGNVLNMPANSIAVSPPMCVDLTYQTARMMVRSLHGSGGLVVGVQYQSANGSWEFPQLSGWIGVPGTTWTLSNPLSVHPSDVSGWQVVRFAISSVGHHHSDSQLYDFYVDPYST